MQRDAVDNGGGSDLPLVVTALNALQRDLECPLPAAFARLPLISPILRFRLAPFPLVIFNQPHCTVFFTS